MFCPLRLLKLSYQRFNIHQYKGTDYRGAGPVQYSKVGKAEAKTVLGIVATGDCSIATAARNGGITKSTYVDWEVESILGIGTYTTTVYAGWLADRCTFSGPAGKTAEPFCREPCVKDIHKKLYPAVPDISDRLLMFVAI
jgi:hypothetical protein